MIARGLGVSCLWRSRLKVLARELSDSWSAEEFQSCKKDWQANEGKVVSVEDFPNSCKSQDQNTSCDGRRDDDACAKMVMIDDPHILSARAASGPGAKPKLRRRYIGTGSAWELGALSTYPGWSASMSWWLDPGGKH